ncbi:predicted glycosyltransferases [Longilinea arvoryzae]|uniref:Predicted glycosyltransferases n=1 Tax=Longilinea arvoryzae TaxID=360412 RepID=A0A0S7BEH9_9CHLR|nr:glycosyltransferase family 2 protein [Longilinea arvoryzae]GAP13949.1 predicted glycosyltransferases [Longilinea arvoryzae]
MTNSEIELSICIVGINAFDYLQKCLESIIASKIDVNYEIIYIDNHSTENGIDPIRTQFPMLIIIQNPQNKGFARANNQGIRIAKGKYILLLNPDTIVEENAIPRMIDYLRQNPDTGIVGPKVLNSDGSFQPHCKRGEARPWEVICYFSRLSSLFPHNPFFSGYLQGHLDENQTHHVPSISGCCMLIRREALDQIGLLDEVFFAYQEDTDYCVRARKAGWNVTYFPSAQIVHFGGKGGANAQPLKAIFEWHRSYYYYYRKNLSQDYFILVNWFFYCLMLLKLIFSLIINSFRKEKYAGPKRG